MDGKMNNDEDKFRKAYLLMHMLGIHCEVINHYHTGGPKYGPSGVPIEGYVYITDLYDILMNEEKLRELVSTLKLKAFW